MCAVVQSNLHQQLKQATQSIHESLHANPLLRRLMAPDCTSDEYRSVLQAFYRFYLRSETAFAVSKELQFSGDAPALQWLREDLIFLGFPVPPPPQNQKFDDFPNDINDLAAYLGFLYVKQGSTLGGQVICRALQKSVRLSPSAGLRFFNGFGDYTRKVWSDFLFYLQTLETAVDASTAAASAVYHFHMIGQSLNENLQKSLKEVASEQHSKSYCHR